MPFRLNAIPLCVHKDFPHIYMACRPEKREGSLIICGDFNIVPDYNLDVSNPGMKHTSPMSKFLQMNDLFDVWRCHHTTERNYTFFSTTHNSYSRIYYFLVDKWLLQRINNSDIAEITWSDHPPSKIGRANSFLIQSSPYAEDLQCQLSEFFQHNVGSVENTPTIWMAH